MVYLIYKGISESKIRKFVSLLDAGSQWQLGLVNKQALGNVRVLALFCPDTNR